MLFSSRLRNWKSSIEQRSVLSRIRRGRPATHRMARRLRLEALEDRTLPSPVLTVTNLAVNGSNGAVVSNSGNFSDTTAGASVTLTASAGTIVQNSNGTWSWSETTPAGAAQTAPVTISAKDSNGQTAATEFWLNVGQVFVVTNTSKDSNTTGSLGWAVTQVDNDTTDTAAQPDLIAFNIPTSDPNYNPVTGAFTIQLPSAYYLNNPVVIDGYTQTGANPNTLPGAQLPSPGSPPTAQTQGDNAVLKIQIDLSAIPSADGNGLNLRANNSTLRGLVFNGLTSDYPAVDVSGNSDVIQGNFLGTDVTGAQVVGNESWGIRLAGSNDVVGGTTPDARNIISGNGNGPASLAADEGGILVGGTGNSVEGNFIGTDISGKKALGNGSFDFGDNGGFGVKLQSEVKATIGGMASGAGNLVSGNQVGIVMGGATDRIQGNLIGTDFTGSSALANGVGIGAQGGGLVGGTTAAARNIISCNGAGLDCLGVAVIEGNYVGTNAQGTAAVGNSEGFFIRGGASGLTVGGTDPGEGNVISGNGHGIRLHVTSNVQVLGNLIGTDYTGTQGIRNTDGIYSQDGATNNTIGGTSHGAGNVIAFSSNNGVTLFNGSGISILGNSIHDNNAKGISLASGANDNQAAPVLTTATSSATSTTISGTLASVANTTFRIEFFANPSPGPSGFGEGQTFLGSVNATTNGSGLATFTASGLVPVPAGQAYLSATATVAHSDGTFGDTSEFGKDGELAVATLTSSAAPSVFGQPVTFTATVGAFAGAGAPTGSVDFVDTTTNTDLGTFALSGGKASVTTSSLAPGTHAIQAIYGGDGTFLGTSGNLSQTVNGAPTTTTVSAAGTGYFGQALTLTATVSANAPSTATPNGSVDFFDTTTNTDLGTATLSASGTATLTTATLPVGTQTITATYAGNASFLASSGSVTTSIVESIYLLNSSLSGDLNVSANASVSNAGLIQVDSKSATAVLASGNATVSAVAFHVVGGVQTSGSATFSVTPVTGAASVFDPEANLPAPTGGTNQAAVNLGGSQTQTINPGIYSQINVAGNAKLTLNPGIYVLAGGGFAVTANGSVSGSGVMLYNAGSNYGTTGSGGNFGGITLSGNGTISLTAPATGTYAGVLIFQERDNNRAIALSGNGVAGLNGGLIYAPQALLNISGNAQVKHSPLIVGQLQVSGNGSSTLTNGVDSTNNTAGQLLAGNLTVYVNNSNGYFTPDELARIQDVITATNSLLVPYGVSVSEVSDPSLANITLDSGTTSPVGGLANGVLGCFTIDTGEITLIQGWNWYAGSNPSAVAASQYSFATTVTHEIGHALGLGGSSDPNSPMFESLPMGVVKGGLTVADLALPALDTTNADALHAAGFDSDPAPIAVGAGPSNPIVPVSASNGVPSAVSALSLNLFASDITDMLVNSLNLYESTLASFVSGWQRADALLAQRFDALLSMGNGALSQSVLSAPEREGMASSLRTFDQLFTDWEDGLQTELLSDSTALALALGQRA
jgi:hypothetical protein